MEPMNHTPLDQINLTAEKEEMKACISNIGLNEEEVQTFMKLIPTKTYKKGEFLLKEGEISAKCYSIIKGCVRQYYMIDGEEKTTFFYTEGHSIFSLQGNQVDVKANHYLSCVEETTLTILTRENELKMYKMFPQLESMSRFSLQEELRNYQEMLANYITTSPEQRYANLLELRPDLLNRVPQYQLASYIGVKPESLSRIRKRISTK